MTITSFDDARAAVRSGMTPDEAARQLMAVMTPDEQLWCLDGDAPTWAGLGFMAEEDGYHKAPFAAAVVDRLGIPGIHFADGPRGAVIGNATCFPVPMARGASWDPELEQRIGDAIGRELRACGATLTGAVCVNVLRHPAWGRAQETYGEDPLHVGEFGAALTRGLQHHVMACVKHFACNSMENARFTVDIEVDDVALHEVYLPHFRRIINEGVASVMSAYNSVNGQWCGQNRDLLTGVLRHEWGFEGFVISDWIFGLRNAALSVTAGLDIEMPYRMVRATGLRDALDNDEVSWEEVRSAVTRILATLLRFDPVLSTPAPPMEVVGCAEHRALAREAAARCMVLVRNEPVDHTPLLPLATDTGVAVVGRLADTVNVGDGGSSDVWDLECRTVLDGLRQTFTHVTHHDGDDPASAAAVAADADVAVVVVGYTYLDEGEFIGAIDPTLMTLFPDADEPATVASFEARKASLPDTTKPDHIVQRPAGFATGGDRATLDLHEHDVELIRSVVAANPRTVVVIESGSASTISDWADQVPAIVLSWYAGAEAGPGLADVLTGTVNPSARLPFSMPVKETDLPPFDRNATSYRYDRWHGWWHLDRTGIAPAYPFGFGLSYTTFDTSHVTVTADGGLIEVHGEVTNTGPRDGADVIQVYAELPDPDAPKRLIGFTRIEIPAGETTPFTIVISSDRLATRDPDSHQWVPAHGPHRIMVGRHAGDVLATEVTVTLTTPTA